MAAVVLRMVVLWVRFLLFLMACSSVGQAVEQRTLTEADYALWGTLKNESVSDDGQWVSYSIAYASGLDTLFVQQVRTGKRYAFAQGRSGRFANASYFGCLVDSNLVWCDLKHGTTTTTAGIADFEVVAQGTMVLLQRPTLDGLSDLELTDWKSTVLHRIVGVARYALGAKSVAYSQIQEGVHSVGILSLERSTVPVTVVGHRSAAFSNLVWMNGGAQLVFVGAGTVYYYRVDERQLYTYATASAVNFPSDLVLDSDSSEALAVSKDGKRVFFMMKRRTPVEDLTDGSAVQVWDGNDADLYLFRQRYGHALDRPRLACWWPETGRFLAVGTAAYPCAFLTGNQDYALLYDPRLHQPTTKYNPDRDYYLMDLETGSMRPFLMAHSESREALLCSPAGKYLSYFKEGHWWVYDLVTQTHTNITKSLPVAFYDEENDQHEAARPYGNVGWTAGDAAILLYDQYDVWQLSPVGKQVHCLTHGREKEVIHRLVSPKDSGIPPSAFYYINTVYDLQHDLLLQLTAKDGSQSGYALRHSTGRVVPLVYQSMQVSGLQKADSKTVYTYLEEAFDCPPRLVVCTATSLTKKVLYKSNRQHYHYGWGRSELVDYTDSKGKALKGVLFYPFDYDSKRQYPMVVSVYERQNHVLHGYTNPTMWNASGFNKTVLCSKGYFVFYPDIVYEVGRPGFSATDCVVAGTKAVLEKGIVDPNRVGLIGHSYGGYETNFIISQTDLFKAAVSGSSVSDLASGYLSLSWSYAKTDYWRYENAQLRMGTSLLDDFEGYRLNSPIAHAKTIRTPLLLWTGEKDRQVNPFQTMEFYLAMRKLALPVEMLVYPNEGHVLLEEKYQMDLTNRILNWFDKYLK